MKKHFFIIFLLFSAAIFAQTGANCGVPAWSSTLGYSANSYVLQNGIIYKSLTYSQGENPTTFSSWSKIGSCEEATFITHPELVYAKCQRIKAFDGKAPNYTALDTISYKFGTYNPKYWIAGNVIPSGSEAYKFLGICVSPPTVNPTFADNYVQVTNSLTPIAITATVDGSGFTFSVKNLKIKNIKAGTTTTNAMTVNGNQATYTWTPLEYGDYTFTYDFVSSINVQTTVTRNFKVAINTPSDLSLVSPENNKKIPQLKFIPIPINFNLNVNGNTIQSIVFTDLKSGKTENITPLNLSNYTYNWTPTAYGNNAVKFVATDTKGTTAILNLNYTIVDPTIENLTFATLPNQIKSIKGIPKTFKFDKAITAVKSRTIPLTTYAVSGNNITFNDENAGRTGLEITTSDGTKYHIGLRIDNADGTIPKFPAYIAVGSVSEDIDDDVNFYKNGINNVSPLQNNRMDCRYIYVNGGPIIGWNTWQPDRVTKFTKNSLKFGLTPIYIYYNIPDGGESYTTNQGHMRDPEYMKAYFVNLNLFLDHVKQEIGDEYFQVILEPDMLGYNQQNNEPPTSTTAVSETTIATNAGTLKTLVTRINKEFANRKAQDKLNFDFGWQLNLWAKPGVAGLRGIIRETDNGNFNTQLEKIKQTARDIYQYGNALGIQSNGAELISIDKYGLDALGFSSSSTLSDPSSYTWFWNNDHWNNYLEFVKALRDTSGKDVILWQVPVGHINGSTTKNEYTGTSFARLNNTSKHYEDSASTFFFGDTVDFSTDAARYNYFSQNKHNDPLLRVDSGRRVITFGNHMSKLESKGCKLVLMGAGVGDSTDGIGNPGSTLTDDHFWIQKLQDYYINNLARLVLATEGFDAIKENDSYRVYMKSSELFISSSVIKNQNISVFLFDVNGKLLLDKKLSVNDSKIEIKAPNTLNNSLYFCLVVDEDNKVSKYKLANIEVK